VVPLSELVVVANPAEQQVVVQPEINLVSVAAPGPPGPAGLQGPPGVPGGSRFNYEQATPAAVWVIEHNLGYKPLFATVIVAQVDVTDGVEIFHIDDNNLTISFSQPVAGEAAFL
jgi:hypothetical protein